MVLQQLDGDESEDDEAWSVVQGVEQACDLG